jgi:hypothetical protein
MQHQDAAVPRMRIVCTLHLMTDTFYMQGTTKCVRLFTCENVLHKLGVGM